MIGIIGAMPVEVDGLIKTVTNLKKIVISKIEFWHGFKDNTEVVIACCGVGKVNAAITTQTMILNFKPKLIINSGVAGGIAVNVNINDVVIASSVVQYDFDTTAIGDPLGLIPGINCVFLECQAENVNKLCEIAVDEVQGTNSQAVLGVVATGDRFVSTQEEGQKICRDFGAIANEMEGGSIGQVCVHNDVDFCVLRVISDSIYGGESWPSFQEFAEQAAKRSIRIIERFLS